jgi:hypothetical protein
LQVYTALLGRHHVLVPPEARVGVQNFRRAILPLQLIQRTVSSMVVWNEASS